MKILTAVGYYLPGYKGGGPIRTIANMVDRLGDELEFKIITMDRDVKDTEPYPKIKLDGWNRVGKTEFLVAIDAVREIYESRKSVIDRVAKTAETRFGSNGLNVAIKTILNTRINSRSSEKK